MLGSGALTCELACESRDGAAVEPTDEIRHEIRIDLTGVDPSSAAPASIDPPSLGWAELESVGVVDRLAWSLIEASPDGVVMTTRDGTILYVNRHTEELFGYRREELLGKPVELLVPLEVRSVHTANRLRYVAAPHSRPMGEGRDLWGRRADGAEFPVEVALSHIDTDEGFFAIAMVRDVSVRRAADQQLRTIHHLLDGISEAVCVIDPDTFGFVHANRGAEILTDYRREQLLEMTPLHILPDLDERQLRDMSEALIAGESTVISVVGVLRRSDGTETQVDVVIDSPPAERGSSRQLVVTMRDISQRLVQEAEQRAAQEQHALMLDRERIARDLHDTAIQELFGAGLTLQSWAARADPATREMIMEIVDRQDAIIREIRTAIFGLTTHRRAHETIIDQALVVVDEVARMLGFRPAFRTSGPVDAAIEGSAVREQLIPVLREMLANAARHSGAQHVEVDLTHSDGWMSVVVADDGVGIRQADRGGNGLHNLATRAEQLGGTMTVTSDETKGTRITWTAPV